MSAGDIHAQEKAESQEWDCSLCPQIICPWDLPGADLPLNPTQVAIFTPDKVSTESATA